MPGFLKKKKNGNGSKFLKKKMGMGKGSGRMMKKGGDEMFFSDFNPDMMGRGNSDIDLLAKEFQNNNPFMGMNGKKKMKSNFL